MLAGVLIQILSFDSVTDGAYSKAVPLAGAGSLYFTTSTTTNGTDQAT